ncbi:MAG: trypsin-like peptidase domain-containing protein [Pirellulaceae bacterium]
MLTPSSLPSCTKMWPDAPSSVLRLALSLVSIIFTTCASNPTALAQDQPGQAPVQQSAPASDQAMAVVSAIESATVSAIERAEHSVVAIARVGRGRAPATQLDQLHVDPFRLGNPFPLQDRPDNPDFVPTLFGSGIVISQDGYIVTCGHVLDDPRENDYYVWLDKQSYSARVVGMPAEVLASDPFSDLAVLKVDASNLQPAAFSQQELRKGQFVIALGNPQAIARDGQASASWGIVSNLKRVAPTDPVAGDSGKVTIHHFGTLIQTDAKLNLGMSGGALIDMRGEVVGLTTALAATAGYEQSAGFAIATDAMFLRVIETLKEGKLPEFGFLGIQPDDLRTHETSRGLRGARVSVVIPGLPGEQAGLRTDDVIYQVDDTPVSDRSDLFRELSQAATGTQVNLFVHRVRPGRNAPDELHLPATLSKKPLNTRWPGYALNAPTKWRGMLVDYATAISSEWTRNGLGGARRTPVKLAILSVDPDTPAWSSGLRPGYGLVSVQGTELQNPDDFYRLAGDRALAALPVELTIIRPNGRSETVEVAP